MRSLHFKGISIETLTDEDYWSCGPGASHERPVVDQLLQGVLELPAVAAKVLEASHIPAEVGTLLHIAGGAQSVFQVGIHLNRITFT